MKLLLVEDDPLLRRQIEIGLSRSGHAVEAVGNAEDALVQLAQFDYDLALIDLGLPGMCGLELIRQVRARGQNLPIMILSARCHWAERVEGLSAGADDYLVKPFQFAELHNRLDALLRRACGFIPPTLVAGPLVLHLNRKQASLGTKPLDLSHNEYRVLEHLMRHHPQVVTQQQLSALSLEGSQHDPNGLEILVSRLQHKLQGVNGSSPIDTVRGEGYRFREHCT